MQVSDPTTPLDAGALNFIYDTIAAKRPALEASQQAHLVDEMCRQHHTTVVQLQAVIFDLVAPRFGMAREPTSAPERRLGLACMMGLKVGIRPDEARRVVDSARTQPERATAQHVAKKLSARQPLPQSDGLSVNTLGAPRAELALYHQDQRILAGIRGDESLLLGMRSVQGSRQS